MLKRVKILFKSENIIEAIASVHPVIEIHNFVFRGEHPKGPELLANNAIFPIQDLTLAVFLRDVLPLLLRSCVYQ